MTALGKLNRPGLNRPGLTTIWLRRKESIAAAMEQVELTVADERSEA
jgi:hypothetical protein